MKHVSQAVEQESKMTPLSIHPTSIFMDKEIGREMEP